MAWSLQGLLVWASVNALGVQFQALETDISSATLAEGLSACHGIIANVHEGAHWVLLTSHVGGDVFTVNDPGYSMQTYSRSEMIRFAVYH